MEVIGKKSKSAVTSAFVGGVFAAALGAAFLIILWTVAVPEFDNDGFIYLVMIVPSIIALMGIYSIFKGVKIARLPNDLVLMDDYGVKLASHEREIKCADIEAVIGENAVFTHHGHDGYTSTSVARYGTIVIRTKDGQRFTQTYVDRVQEVAQIMNNRIIKK